MNDIQVTATEAAHQVGVTRATIDTWVHRGYLYAVDPTVRPRRYWLSEVFMTEAARRNQNRLSGVSQASLNEAENQ